MRWRVEVTTTDKHAVVKKYIRYYKNKKDAQKYVLAVRRSGNEVTVEEVK